MIIEIGGHLPGGPLVGKERQLKIGKVRAGNRASLTVRSSHRLNTGPVRLDNPQHAFENTLLGPVNHSARNIDCELTQHTIYQYSTSSDNHSGSSMDFR